MSALYNECTPQRVRSQKSALAKACASKSLRKKRSVLPFFCAKIETFQYQLTQIEKNETFLVIFEHCVFFLSACQHIVKSSMACRFP